MRLAEERAAYRPPSCPFLRCSSSLRSTSMYCSHSSWCVSCDSSSIRFLLPVFDQPSTLGAVLNHKQHTLQAEFGLHSIRERTALLQGTTEVYSSPEGGVGVRIRIPLRNWGG